MTRVDIKAVTQWITAAAVRHPFDLAAVVAQRNAVTRASAARQLRRLVQLNWLVREGTPRRPRFRPGPLRQVVQHYALAGLQEDLPWARDFAPFFPLPGNVQRLVQHAFCELLNNAIDHSEGQRVTVSLRQTPSHVQLLVSDDGRGLFAKLREAFALEDPTLAMLELSKGKLTSEPGRHSGHGLFFTARIADVFDVHANAVAFQRRGWEDEDWQQGRAMAHHGTSIFVGIALDTARTLEAVRGAHSLSGEGCAFERTVVPLRLIASPHVALDARAQARRVAQRLNRFGRVEVDFSGVPLVGHGFADELFRVQALAVPEVELVPINMSSAVAAMLASVRAQPA